MSRRFLTLSRLFEIVVLARRAASFRFTCASPCSVSIQRAMAAKTSEGRLSVHPSHGTDMRGLELLRKFLQYSTPIDSTTNSAGRARAGPANSDIPLSSRARRVWPGHLTVVLGAESPKLSFSKLGELSLESDRSCNLEGFMERFNYLRAGYSAQCTVRGCRARATMLAPDTPMTKAGREG